jgi:hypothetical protein
VENTTPDPSPRASFSLAQLVLVGLLALGAGAGTAWFLTGGGESIQTATKPAPIERPAPAELPAPPRAQPVTAPRLAAPDAGAVAQPAPVARRDLSTAPAAAPIPLPAQRGSSGSSAAVKLDYGDDDERALAPAPPAQAQQGPARVGDCERFTTEIVIEGRRTTRSGTACLQADGTWKIKGEN